MIVSFHDADTQEIWRREHVGSMGATLQRAALRKLVMVDAAANLDDLRVPPGNRLEALSHDRRGQHSIRVNDQYRVCFVWATAGAEDVEITDYH